MSERCRLPECGSSSPLDPLVSVVTPILNGRRFLPDLMQSLHAQDYPHLEHVVVDGGSTDGTVTLLEQSPGVVWTSGPDAGMYDAINRGFALAKGEILAYQNADDRYCVPDAVSRSVAFLQAHPQVDVVYGDFRLIDEDGRPLARRVSGRAFSRRALLRHNYIAPHTAFVRRRVLSEAGLWLDPKAQFAGDWDWFVRMALAGRTLAYQPGDVAEFRVHARSKTATHGFARKLREWRWLTQKNHTSLSALLWSELFWVPLRRRLGLRP
jgi:glycosyltransferase involved in cell wall biosynthesis